MLQRRQVVIVGAGPVGLLTALGLARQGVQVTVLDAEDSVLRAPRTAVLPPAARAVLNKLALLDEAAAIGLSSSAIGLRWPATGKVFTGVRRGSDQADGHALHLEQHRLVELGLAHLARLPGTQVLWNHTVKALAQGSNGAGTKARLAVDTDDGEVWFEADWIIGADGANSTVRKLLGLEFVGSTWPERFVTVDIDYPLQDHGWADATLLVDPVDWALVARIGRDLLWRVTLAEDAALPEGTIGQRLPDRLAAILPDPAVPCRIDTFIPYRAHQRCVATFRRGHVLLAGDAAHVCNPFGDLALAGGLLDADAVSGALGAVIAGRANDAALDIYAAERRRLFLEVTNPASIELKRLVSETDPTRRSQDQRTVLDCGTGGGSDLTASALAILMKGAPMAATPPLLAQEQLA